jgi:hypothetical protein
MVPGPVFTNVPREREGTPAGAGSRSFLRCLPLGGLEVQRIAFGDGRDYGRQYRADPNATAGKPCR